MRSEYNPLTPSQRGVTKYAQFEMSRGKESQSLQLGDPVYKRVAPATPRIVAMTPTNPTCATVAAPALVPVDGDDVPFALRMPACDVIEFMKVVPHVDETLDHNADCLPRIGDEARPRA